MTSNKIIILAEKYCLDNGLREHDGSPIKGEAAHYIMGLFGETDDDSGLKLLQLYEKLGIITTESKNKANATLKI